MRVYPFEVGKRYHNFKRHEAVTFTVDSDPGEFEPPPGWKPVYDWECVNDPEETRRLCQSWLDAGRGISLWQNVALDSCNLGHLIMTPGDAEKPDWKYCLLEKLDSLECINFIPAKEYPEEEYPEEEEDDGDDDWDVFSDDYEEEVEEEQ